MFSKQNFHAISPKITTQAASSKEKKKEKECWYFSFFVISLPISVATVYRLIFGVCGEMVKMTNEKTVSDRSFFCFGFSELLFLHIEVRYVWGQIKESDYNHESKSSTSALGKSVR